MADTTTPVPIPDGDWVLIADNIPGYRAQVTDLDPVQIYFHNSNEISPEGTKGAHLKFGESTNLSGILWARSSTGRPTEMTVIS